MSNNLALAQVAAAQNNKEITINDQVGRIAAGAELPGWIDELIASERTVRLD
jgi:hypothetical protein